mmetsp:Transcript_8988/g.23946  ORF Transcript_8988/g.23946 Transcript_8988/m.23946 type:complete len:212 (-) Transcript_8988:88-723(-)
MHFAVDAGKPRLFVVRGKGGCQRKPRRCERLAVWAPVGVVLDDPQDVLLLWNECAEEPGALAVDPLAEQLHVDVHDRPLRDVLRRSHGQALWREAAHVRVRALGTVLLPDEPRGVLEAEPGVVLPCGCAEGGALQTRAGPPAILQVRAVLTAEGGEELADGGELREIPLERHLEALHAPNPGGRSPPRGQQQQRRPQRAGNRRGRHPRARM